MRHGSTRPPGYPKKGLSVLDLSPIPSGSTAGDALRNSIDLAQHAELLGYTRVWLAEHHNAGSLASSAPEILIGQIAACTRTIRVGAGGIMLPNHAPLKVAEVFRVLSALFPGRIDLGLGRAAGTDPRTARELRRDKPVDDEEIASELDVLLDYLAPDDLPRKPFSGTTIAVPANVASPKIWMLGSSDKGSATAAERGFGFAFAHHMNPEDAPVELRKYRETFRPGHTATPHSIVAVSVVCAETDEEARRLASSGELSWLRFSQGMRDQPLPSIEESLAHVFDADERAAREAAGKRSFVGSPERVRSELGALVEATRADEIIVMTHVHAHEARRRSYELLARAFDLAPET